MGRGPHVDARAESARAMSPLDAGSMMLLKAAAKEACRLAVPRARCRSPSAGKDDDVRRCSTIAFGAKTSEAIRACGLTWNAWQAGGRRYLGSRSLVCVCVCTLPSMLRGCTVPT